MYDAEQALSFSLPFCFMTSTLHGSLLSGCTCTQTHTRVKILLSWSAIMQSHSISIIWICTKKKNPEKSHVMLECFQNALLFTLLFCSSPFFSAPSF